jgi:hypothetical protein
MSHRLPHLVGVRKRGYWMWMLATACICVSALAGEPAEPPQSADRPKYAAL